MGLCKCPKRKVTNLFCFEHRVNVCESCLVSSHESCVVQTYLSWLTDSDYDSNCILCTEPLSSGETIRLKCFHVFHWSCLNQRASQLPNTTAPAGYKCPSCLDVIFPAANQTSPVIDQLREKLHKVSWAAAGLSSEGYSTQNLSGRISPPAVLEHSNGSAHKPGRNSFSAVTIENPSDDPFEGNTFTARTKLLGNDAPNHMSDARNSSSTVRNLSEGDDSPGAKYARKASERRSVRFHFSRLPRSVTRILLALVVLIIIYFVIAGKSSIFDGGGGSQNAEEDPMFDPHANPNIRIESNK